MRAPRILLIAALAIGSLAGCGADPKPVPTDRIKAIVADIGGDPGRFYQAEVAYKPLADQHFTSQQVYLVPVGDGKQFRIVDINGMVYQDYADYLRNNALTR